MKKRSILVSMLSLVLVVLLLAGCAKSSAAPAGSSSAAPSAPATPAAPSTPSAAPAAPAAPASTKPVPPAGYPSKTINFIIPQSPGGGTDTGARLLVKYMQEYVNKPIVILNYPGGSSAIGIAELKKLPADGHSMYVSLSQAVVKQLMDPGQFDCATDFKYCALQVADPRILCFRTGEKNFKTREEFIDYVKKNPGKVNIAIPGQNNTGHIQAIEFIEKTGLKMNVVTFDGQASAKPAFLSGECQAIWQSVGEAVPMYKEKQLDNVFVTAEKRSPFLPEVPTAKELGYNSVYASYRGVAFVKDAPQNIVDFWQAVIEDISKNPKYQEEMKNVGLSNDFVKGADYLKITQSEITMYREVLGKLNLLGSEKK